MKDKIKFAVVGCGSIGKRHIAVLDAEPNADIVAICDTDELKCKEQSILYNNIPWFTSYEKMLNEINVDIVNVVTPHAMHADMSSQALNKGFNVLVEKPMALSVKDCIRMNEAAVKNGKKLWWGKPKRHKLPIKIYKV